MERMKWDITPGLPVVPSDHPIRVQHRDEFEDKHAAQHCGPWIILSQNKLQEAIEHKAGWRLPGMDTAAQEENLPTEITQRKGHHPYSNFFSTLSYITFSPVYMYIVSLYFNSLF